MGVIWTPQTRNRQPQGDVGLANTSLTQGIVFIEYGHGRDRKQGILPTAGTATQGVGLGGLGLRFNGSSDYQRYVNPTGFTTPLSFFSVFVTNDTTNNALVGLAKSTEDVNGMVVLRLESGNVGIFTYEPTSGFTEGRTTATVATGKLLTAGGSVSAAGAKTAYLSGLPGTTTTNATSLTSSDRLTVGRTDRVSPVHYFNGTIFLTAAWDRVLSPAEFLELNRNPWQLFAPERKPLIFDLGSASGSPYSMDAEAGSYTLTGVDAAFKASRTLVAEAGSYALTGIDATFKASRTILADAGSYVVSGQDATFTYTPSGSGSPYSMDADAGSYTITSVDATFKASRTLVAEAGSYALTGVDASFTRSEYRLVAETGSYVISGQSATFSTTGSVVQSTRGGSGTGRNLSRKQKKKLKAVESQEWLKAEETARQLLSDRFTKQTPQEKAQALETYIESLQPVIEALKALTSQIEEVVEETPVIELTPHQEVIQRFDRLEKKVKSVEELIIILMADL